RLVLGSAANTNAWRARYPGVAVAGWFEGKLANAGERIALRDARGNTVVSVDYVPHDGWPSAADGSGYSLELIDPSGDPDAPANWKASTVFNGTPGLPAVSSPPAPIVINEIQADNRSTITNGGFVSDWIELYNPSGQPVLLAGWSLSDNGDPRKFVFTAGANIGAGNYLVFWCDTNTVAPGYHTGFYLGSRGESVFLYDPATNRVDAVAYGVQLADYSVGRLGDGSWHLCVPTPGTLNSASAVADAASVLINEWQANPLPGGDDWIELF